jgi:putative acetyltransferase
MRMQIRPEQAEDKAAVRAVNEAAFGTSAEANLVERLHAEASPLVSLVAEEGAAIVGHILFSPVTLSGIPGLQVMGLAPMAVLPDRQRRGIGSLLVAEGLDACRKLGAAAIVVLGHATYYPRFGFVSASRFGISSDYDVPDEVFMALELKPGTLSGRAGEVRYHEAFSSV